MALHASDGVARLRGIQGPVHCDLLRDETTGYIIFMAYAPGEKRA